MSSTSGHYFSFTMLHFAWRNIWRHPRRTILTMLAIAFGAVLLVFSIGIQLGQYDIMIKNSVRVFHGLLQVQKKDYLDDPKLRTSIPAILSLAEKLRHQTGLESISARANGFALVSSSKRSYGTLVAGVDVKNESRVSTIPGVVKEGRFLSSNEAQEIIIGKSLAKNMQVSIGDEVTFLGTGRDGSIAATILPVVGIFESGAKELDRNLVEMPINVFQQTFDMRDHGHSVVIYDENIRNIEQLKKQISAALKGTDDLVVLDWEALQPGLRQMIEIDYASGWVMYVALVVIITFSIMNTFLMSVLERTREFGIMLALGYRPLSIGVLVMLEAFMLTMLALVLGTLAGYGINLYFAHYGLTFEGMEQLAELYNMPSTIRPLVSVRSIFTGPCIILVFTLLAALYPAMRIRKLEPVEAMRKI